MREQDEGEGASSPIVGASLRRLDCVCSWWHVLWASARECTAVSLLPLEICSVFVDEHLVARRAVVAHLIVAEGGCRQNHVAVRTAETFCVVGLAGGAHALALVHRLQEEAKTERPGREWQRQGHERQRVVTADTDHGAQGKNARGAVCAAITPSARLTL